MKARQLIGGASFGPAVLKTITKAFDEAWAEIEPAVSTRPQAIEAARLDLANVVLSLAKDDTTDADQLKQAALQSYGLKRRAWG